MQSDVKSSEGKTNRIRHIQYSHTLTQHKDTLDVRTVQLGTNHCGLFAVVPLDKDNVM